MKTVNMASNERYLEEQIAIMTGLLAQMTDGYAMARLRIQIRQLEAALDTCRPA